MFSLSISGTVNADSQPEAEAIEQAIADDLRAVISKHSDHITVAGGSFDYSGSIDLLPAAAPAASAGADPNAPVGGDGTGAATPVTPPPAAADPNAPVDPAGAVPPADPLAPPA